MRTGTVYLIHFHRPYRHARHYVGFTTDLADRMHRHAYGTGGRLVAVVMAAGIGWTLARTWLGVSRQLELQIKRAGHTARRCPLCSPARVRRELRA